MKEIMGGLWIGALVTGALGLWGGALLLAWAGAVAGLVSWLKQLSAEKQAQSWRKSYPSYKY